MAEQYVLTTPIPVPDKTQYQVRQIMFYYLPPNRSRYDVTFIAPDGSEILYAISDSAANAYGPGTAANLATTRLKALNTLNLATQSMQRRLLTFASTDINPATGQTFLPPGTVTGTPDV